MSAKIFVRDQKHECGVCEGGAQYSVRLSSVHCMLSSFKFYLVTYHAMMQDGLIRVAMLYTSVRSCQEPDKTLPVAYF
jgi:hypothetical protein